MARHAVETDRLLLRRWLDKDYAPFAEICADPAVMRYIGNGSTRTAEQASKAIIKFETEWAEKGYGLFAVEQKQTGEFIGFTGFSWPGFLPEVLPSVEIGWRFSKHCWGNGYASEAASAALSYGTSALHLTDIVSIYQIGNAASERIMQKLGMVFDCKTVDPTCGRDVAVYRLPQG
ncbi:GNAT family N-acetyltransferase [Rhodospirillaceae bacterium KN72]|uniref:GNAT family N-acetyltransferase n=1 Tax=Pacificispira spongiicola TaxID=2729598 RepID=A0A7Y0HGL6_9PROT|nr:GNAT family N-acetyltransferase [Pacificispira spongiicola]NMM45788.1 GNAT family N-acetyltransferase [Pacificispira spongiicola]